MKLYAVKTDHRTVGIYGDPIKAVAHADAIEPSKCADGFYDQVLIVVYEVESDWK